MFIAIILLAIAIIIIFMVTSNKRDNFTFSENNMLYWPQYYYSFPYNYKKSGIWPPGMYNKLNYWSPGFYTGSGLSWENRPGMGEKWWPRNRWIRKPIGGDYYNITNADDWIHDAASYQNKMFTQ